MISIGVPRIELYPIIARFRGERGGITYLDQEYLETPYLDQWSKWKWDLNDIAAPNSWTGAVVSTTHKTAQKGSCVITHYVLMDSMFW